MKTWLSIISVMILVGLLAGMALQVQAQDEPQAILTFHVLPNGSNKSTSLETIPPDAPDKILIQGTTEAASNVSLLARIRNYCGSWSPAGTGTPTATNSPTPTFTPTGVPTQSGALECYQVDIYWTMSIIVNWRLSLP